MKTLYTHDQISQTKYITKLLGDEHNLLILFELMKFGEKSFNELKRMTDINAVSLSKKLHLLRCEGIVDMHECGNENHYFLTQKAERIRPLIADIENLIHSEWKEK